MDLKPAGAAGRVLLMDLWHQILRTLEPRISPESFHNWLEPVRFSHIDQEKALHLIAPNASAKQWLEAEFKEIILTAAEGMAVDVKSVSVTEAQAATEAAPMPLAWRTAAMQTTFNFNVPSMMFNAKYTFENFVVGSCNEFAHAAARAVASNPARAYNPLYIYGGVGMGKTHLIHAIGHQLKANFRDLQVVYVTSEEFMNEMINSLRYDRMGSFHERFRSADALLVDDIQVLGSKERTQEEFFHTFNALHNMQKQIVISSDRPPKQVPGLVDRLRSRFEWGLLADIQPPDLETKMAILDRKAEEYHLSLPDAVRIYMATNMKSNLRELEGALTRLMAIASMSECEITLQMAKQTLHSIIDRSQQVTFDAILRVVGEEYGLEPRKLREKSNTRAIAFPRQIAMYLSKELIGASLPEIGKAFGGKHHTTVLHAVNKIERLRHHDRQINSQIHKLSDRIN
jgi:chromosomal replication initiator protein